MKFVRFYILFVILISLLSFKVKACSCNEVNSVKEEIETTDFVGIETILKMEYFSSQYAKQISDSTKAYDLRKYEILVSKTFKGLIANDTITVFTGLGHTDCGITLEKDSVYIIYGDVNYTRSRPNYPNGNDIFWTSICKRTVLKSNKEISKIERQLKNKK